MYNFLYMFHAYVRVFRKRALQMEGSSQASQNISGNPGSSATASTHTGLLNAEYVCPVCNATVLTIQGNVLRYVKSHVREVQDDSGDHVSLVMYHNTAGGDFLPGKVMEHPFLAVQSSTMVSFSSNS